MDKLVLCDKNYFALYVIVIIIYCIVFFLLWNRLHYGVEISDEAFYVAEAYIIANGAIPYAEVLTIAAGAAWLYSPIVNVYISITDGTEGIYLFMRQAFFVYKLLVSGVLFLIFKRSFPLFLAILLPLPYFAHSIHSIDNFSYNTLSVSLLMLGCAALFTAMREGEKYAGHFSTLGGVLIALTILSHPMLLFAVVFLFVVFIIIEQRRYKTLIRSCFFTAGGFVTGFAVTLHIVIMSKGIMPLINGLSALPLAPIRHAKPFGLSNNLELLKDTLIIFKDFSFLAVCVFICLFIVFFALTFDWRNKKFNINTLKIVYIFTIFITQIIYILNSKTAMGLQTAIDLCIGQTYVVALLLFVVKLREKVVLLCLFSIPFIVYYLLYIPIGTSGLYMRGYVLLPSIMVSIVFMYYAINEMHLFVPLFEVYKKLIASVCVIILIGFFCFTFVKSYYVYIYRDAPITELTYRMESGVFKGLYTVEERGKALIFLEDELKKVTNAQDIVLFKDQAPQAYLMTQAEHCAPSTWDVLRYSHVYYDAFPENYDAMGDFMLQEYFKAAGKVPNKIIYVQDKERLEHISLWNENIRFNKYVEQYYIQTYANNADHFAIIVFERKTS